MTVTVVEESLSSGSFIAMESLFEKLLQQKFNTSQEAIQFCYEACLEYGFTVKQETNQANRSIYMRCSSASCASSDNNNNGSAGTPILRKRPSSLTNESNGQDCPWRVVLAENEFTQEWIFRKSMNQHASKHNHDLNSGTEGGGEVWPQEVSNKIIQLARSSQQESSKREEIDKEICETIKLEYPDIEWNERRFLTLLNEERKRQRQKSITERVQKLIMASTKLCSVVAANEDWASCVESDLSKMLENYRQMTRVSSQSLDSMVDLQLNMIHSEVDNKQSQPGVRRHSSAVFNKQEDDLFFGLGSGGGGNKKRKMMMAMTEGVQIMSIPSCTLFIRSQPLRSLSEPSSSQTSKRSSNAAAAQQAAAQAAQQQHQQQQQAAAVAIHQQQQQQAAQMVAVQQAQQMAMHQQHAYDLHHHNHHHQPQPFHFALQTSPVSSPSSTSSIQQRIDYGGYNRNDMLQSPPLPDSSNSGIVSPNNYHHPQQGHSPNHYSTTRSGNINSGGIGTGGGGGGGRANNVYPFSPYPTSTNQHQNDFVGTFDQNSTSYGSGGGSATSPAPILMNQQRGGGYYTSNQRLMMQQQQQQQQQEYDHLPIIRSTATTAATANNNLITTATMVQQQQQQQQQGHHHYHHHHHHPHSHHHHPPPPQQNWS